MSKANRRSLKLKASKYCIMDNALYWKDPGGLLLNCLIEDESKEVINDFHKGDCGGHLYQKITTNKVLRVGYYLPTLFTDIYKAVMSCHKCQVFQCKRKHLPFPLQPISIHAPFQQWGLYFIGEINPSSSAQHKWILTITYYFTKWIEVIPTRQATDSVIIQFLETNILFCFGCPNNIIIDNVTSFKSKKLTDFCDKYNIKLGHSTTYYLQGNGLAESSNKFLIYIIKKMLEANKRNQHKKLIKRCGQKSLGISPFQIVYGLDTVFPSLFAIPVMKLLQEEGIEENGIEHQINQMIHL